MAGGFRRAMDALYLACVLVAGGSLVLISVIIPWGVFTRYVLNSASSWPEPMAILLGVVLTFIGAAACYRVAAHMRVGVLPNALSGWRRRACELAAEALVALLNLFMVIWGIGLAQTTWNQTVPDFPFLSVGLTYLPIPVGGCITLLFIIERVVIGLPPAAALATPSPD